MSGEIEALGTVARIAIAVLGPAIEAALAGGEPEAAVIARLQTQTLAVRDTTAEDRARRERLASLVASVSRVSAADVDVARRLTSGATLSGEERASILRLVGVVDFALRQERADEPTERTEVPR